MPISIDEFESGEAPGAGLSTAERVVGFLAANDDKAFTRGEIAEALDADPNTVGTNLSRLKKRGMVRHKGRYWAITEDQERLEAYGGYERATALFNERFGSEDADAWEEAAPDEPHPSLEDGT